MIHSDLSAEDKLCELFHRRVKLIESDRAIFTILIQEQWGDLFTIFSRGLLK